MKLDVATAVFVRGPRESTGTFALDMKMVELAVALDMDPLKLRLVNYVEQDP